MNNLKEGYRNNILRGIIELETGKKHYTDQQFFDNWFDNYSSVRLEEFKKYKALSKEEFEYFDALDEIMKIGKKALLNTTILTEKMWEQILEKLHLLQDVPTIKKSMEIMLKNDQSKKDKYREGTINMIQVYFLPEKNMGEDEFFYVWLDDIYRGDLIELMKRIGSFSEEEFQLLDVLDAIVKKKFKEWKDTNFFTDEMWAEINTKRQEFLDLV